MSFCCLVSHDGSPEGPRCPPRKYASIQVLPLPLQPARSLCHPVWNVPQAPTWTPRFLSSLVSPVAPHPYCPACPAARLTLRGPAGSPALLSVLLWLPVSAPRPPSPEVPTTRDSRCQLSALGFRPLSLVALRAGDAAEPQEPVTAGRTAVGGGAGHSGPQWWWHSVGGSVTFIQGGEGTSSHGCLATCEPDALSTVCGTKRLSLALKLAAGQVNSWAAMLRSGVL